MIYFILIANNICRRIVLHHLLLL